MSAKIKKSILSVFIFLIISLAADAQRSFKQQTDLPVSENNKQYVHPWTGGFNNPQLSAADLNNDGIEDLVIFDRTGDKVVTFINNGTPGKVDYEYAPKYQRHFPDILLQWMLMGDYDCDGIADMFAWLGIPGAHIDLYKGRFNGNNELVFDSIGPFTYNTQSSGNQFIFVSPIDVPAIADINNDGDLDVLSFDQLGGEIEYYENQSMELTGTCGDTVLFEKYSECWGTAYETPFSNILVLDSCLGFNKRGVAAHAAHPGSCTMAFDEDGDNDMEIILGDISFNYINRLINGGTPNLAHLVEQDHMFPSYDVSYNSPVFPCSFYLDVNNDQLKDLVVAPNATHISENFNCIWYYENIGTVDSAIFNFQTDTFLNKNSIDLGEGAQPAFFDHNNDGLMDLVVGNYGYYTNGVTYRSSLALFENTGTKSDPKFVLKDRDYALVSRTELEAVFPAFGDMDDDGDKDMILGDVDGYLHYFENTAGPGNTASFTLDQVQYFGIDYNQHTAPLIYDANGDEVPDLILGARDGKLRYFENQGTKANAFFSSVPTNIKFGNIDTRQPGFIQGYSSPVIDNLGTNKTYLLTGNDEGYIEVYLFDQDSIYSGSFKKMHDQFSGIDEGERSTLAIADLNDDGDLEMVVGNYRGGLALFSQGSVGSSVGNIDADSPWQISLYPNPAENTITAEWNIRDLSGETIRIEVIDVLGRLHSSRVVDQVMNINKVQIDVASLSAGVYFFRMTDGSKVGVEKFVISRK